MNLSRRSLLLGCSAFGFATAARAAPAPIGPLGLEIYSLRREMAKDIPRTLALIRQMEFEEVEVPERQCSPQTTAFIQLSALVSGFSPF